MRVHNWDKFQHYKNAKPAWIKVYRDLLNNPQWHRLSGDAAKALVMIWLVAAEDDEMGGKLPPQEDLAFKIRYTEEKLASVLEELRDWLIGLSREPLDNPLEPIENDSMPEKRREETEKEKKPARAREEYTQEFEEFWKTYPKKKKKGAAFRAWRNAKKKTGWPGLKAIIQAIESAKPSQDWTENGGKYIPHPATWLNDSCWEDECLPNQSSLGQLSADDQAWEKHLESYNNE